LIVDVFCRQSLLFGLYHVAAEIDLLMEPHLFIRDDDRSAFGGNVEKTGIIIEENW
jgi:hypothetical protein